MILLRLRYRHWLPRWLRVSAIVLYPYVLFSKAQGQVSPELLRHEMVHVRQVRSLGWIRFYFFYAWEYLRLRRQGLNSEEAYRNISFDKEAYATASRIELSESEQKETGPA